MRIDWQRAILAGIAGTIAFDVLGLLLTGRWWDIPALLGTKLGIGLVSSAEGARSIAAAAKSPA